MQPLLHLEGIIELLQLRQDDDESHDDEQHDENLAGVVVRVNVSVPDRAERDQHEPDGVKEIELCVYELHAMDETHP